MSSWYHSKNKINSQSPNNQSISWNWIIATSWKSKNHKFVWLEIKLNNAMHLKSLSCFAFGYRFTQYRRTNASSASSVARYYRMQKVVKQKIQIFYTWLSAGFGSNGNDQFKLCSLFHAVFVYILLCCLSADELSYISFVWLMDTLFVSFKFISLLWIY